jgi:hypothetical protein
VFDSILKTLPNASARRLEEGLVRVCYTTAVQIHWYLVSQTGAVDSERETIAGGAIFRLRVP